MKFAILFTTVLTAALGPIGASTATAAPSDPADGKASVPPVEYQSPFAEYRPLGDDKNTAWKDANDTVGKIGGWRAYAREAAEALKAREAINTRKLPDADASKPKPVPAAPVTPPAAPTQPHKHGG